MSVVASAATSALASYLPDLSPYTTERLVEVNSGSVNYLTGDCTTKGGMTQTTSLVTLTGNNQWYASNVMLDLGAVDRVFNIPELHLVQGGSIKVASGTLKAGSSSWWVESGGGTLTVAGAASCFELGANVNFGHANCLSDFSLLGGASMTGAYTFTFGSGGTFGRQARIAGPGTTVNLAALSIGSSSSGNRMEVSDASVALTGSLTMGSGNYKLGANYLSLSNATLSASVISIGSTTSRNTMEIADGSTVTASRLNVGVIGKDNVLTNCLENGVLVTGAGTKLSLSSDNKVQETALRVGHLHSATNRLTVADGAVVSVIGSAVIGQESDSRGNVVTVDGAFFAVNPPSSGHTVYVGMAGRDNDLIVDNRGVFDATNVNVSVQMGNTGRIVSRNGSAVRIRALNMDAYGVGSCLEADGASISVSSAFTVPGSKYPLFTMKGADPRLSFDNITYNGGATNVFVLGKASKPSTDAEYMFTANGLNNNVGNKLRFVVRVEAGCPDGEYNLLTWESGSWADVDLASLFKIEKPEDYKVELHYQYKDNPSAGYGKYFKVTVRRKKGLLFVLR